MPIPRYFGELYLSPRTERTGTQIVPNLTEVLGTGTEAVPKLTEMSVTGTEAAPKMFRKHQIQTRSKFAAHSTTRELQF